MQSVVTEVTFCGLLKNSNQHAKMYGNFFPEPMPQMWITVTKVIHTSVKPYIQIWSHICTLASEIQGESCTFLSQKKRKWKEEKNVKHIHIIVSCWLPFLTLNVTHCLNLASSEMMTAELSHK